MTITYAVQGDKDIKEAQYADRDYAYSALCNKVLKTDARIVWAYHHGKDTDCTENIMQIHDTAEGLLKAFNSNESPYHNVFECKDFEDAAGLIGEWLEAQGRDFEVLYDNQIFTK